MELRERLAELRREEGLTLRQLRDRIEALTKERISISYLSEIERLDTTPSIDTLAKIARAYDISVADLLAPVDFFEERTEAQYPKSLRAFLAHEGLHPDWAMTLSRIEFRGHRPQSEDDWRAVYSVLKALIPDREKRGR